MGRRRKHAPPAMREHRGKNLAYVTIEGKQVYLGPIGSPEAAKKYRKVVEDWERQHGARPDDFVKTSSQITIMHLVAAHTAHARIHYRRADGSLTSEVRDFAKSLEPVLMAHMNDSPDEFRTVDLRRIIDGWVGQGLSRETVNKMAGRIKRVWQWGVGMELVSAEAAGALMLVRDLQSGRTLAPDYQEILPVPLRDFARTLRLVHPTIAAMLRTQYYCGARPGEVCAMRAEEIYRSAIRIKNRSIPLPEGIWAFVPAQHKNLSKGKSIRYMIGPRLQKILLPRLAEIKSGFLFPAPEVAHYRVDNYGQAIDRACQMAGVRCMRCGEIWHRYERTVKKCPCGATGDDLEWSLPRWSPNQLRHNFLTRMDRLVGIAAASSSVSHASVATTAIYVEKGMEGDAKNAMRFG